MSTSLMGLISLSLYRVPRAHVTTPSTSSPVVDMILLDNGVGADAIRDDGIYTKYFTQFDGKVSLFSYVFKCNILYFIENVNVVKLI